MAHSGLYSINGRQLNARGHLLLLGLLLLAYLVANFSRSPLLAECKLLELDLNELAPGEDFDEQERPDIAAGSAPPSNQAQTANEDAGKTAADRAASERQTWLQAAHNWRSRTTNAISEFKNKLPEYFDFEQFRKSFKRNYSPSEYFYRKSLFLSKCFQVLKSRVAYRLGVSSRLEGVNKFSDRSGPEIKRMFMSGPPIEFKPASQSMEDYYEQVEREFNQRERAAAEQVELVSKSSLTGEADEQEHDQLARLFLNSALPGEEPSQDASMAENFNEELLGRPIFSEKQARFQLERIVALANLQADVSLGIAIKEELLNGPIESYSQASCVDSNDDQCSMGKQPLPWPGRRQSPARAAINKSNLPDLNDAASESQDSPLNYRNPLTEGGSHHDFYEHLDWSEHECFHQIYDQGDKCGKCYVIASTSLAEFYKCSEQFGVINQRKFSKQFVLDCGQKFSPSLMGCLGGSILEALRFIGQVGAHSVRGWKLLVEEEQARAKREGAALTGLDAKCPLNKFSKPMDRWADIKIEINPQPVQVSDWLEALQDGPLVASVQMPAFGLDSYASGVHEGTGCQDSSLWHSMLLVGYGTDERGLAYWRFRNSWGANWGDRGHFNLAMSVPAECLAGGVRVYREPMPVEREGSPE